MFKQQPGHKSIMTWTWNKSYRHSRPTCTTDVVSYQHQRVLWPVKYLEALSRLNALDMRITVLTGRLNPNALLNQQI